VTTKYQIEKCLIGDNRKALTVTPNQESNVFEIPNCELY